MNSRRLFALAAALFAVYALGGLYPALTEGGLWAWATFGSCGFAAFCMAVLASPFAHRNTRPGIDGQ